MCGVPPVALVIVCRCCTFFSISDSCWFKNSSYSDAAGFGLLSGSRLEDLTGEGERSISTELVLLLRNSSFAEGNVSLSAEEDLKLKVFF